MPKLFIKYKECIYNLKKYWNALKLYRKYRDCFSILESEIKNQLSKTRSRLYFNPNITKTERISLRATEKCQSDILKRMNDILKTHSCK